MMFLLDSVGPAVWRASWQATALALLVCLLVRSLGERISPRWRYLLWSVVMIRFLFVATPAAPWSVFNLVPRQTEKRAPEMVNEQADRETRLDSNGEVLEAQRTPGQLRTVNDSPRNLSLGSETPARPPKLTVVKPVILARTALESSSSLSEMAVAPFVARILSSIWLAGSLLCGLHLARTAVALRRRLVACRLVTDAAVLKLLETACLRIGRKRIPNLLVTPDSISPCIVGTWNPRIIVPEAIVTASSTIWLRHVLLHELAHLVRADLWTNWLLLTTRIVHWFNPAAWWTIRAMQSEREAACDELALAELGEADRHAYAATIIELASHLAPSPMAPAMIGLISSARRLKARVERLLQFPSVSRIRAPFAVVCLLGIALPGLTDAIPATVDPPQPPAASDKTPSKPATVPAKGATPESKTATLSGRCIDQSDRSALPGVRVRLFKVEGRTAPIVEAANTVTDGEGQFEFANLTLPRPEAPVDRLIYLVFAEAAARPIGLGGMWTMMESDPLHMEISILRDMTALSGTVLDSHGLPVKGAKVSQWAIDGRLVPGILSATTDVDGRFQINRIPDFQKVFVRPNGAMFTISHPDFPQTEAQVADLPANVSFTLTDGCKVTGMVTDGVTGKPAVGAVVVANQDGGTAEFPTATNDAGRFQMVLVEGRYTFRVDAKDRVCVAVTDRECLAGDTLELPPLELNAGGFISGRVVNTATGKAVAVSQGNRPIAIGLYGPSQPYGKVISPTRLTTVDDAGRFTVRAAPGENFPYFVNIQGDRMSWDTHKQAPVLVKEGETTTYDMLITPEIPPATKLHAARKLVDSLPAQPTERTDRILLEYRKLNRTVDETELWCTLMRELVAIGPDSVPRLCSELDLTTEDRMLRRLAFALRAIGDPRAVPALIRALPKTLLPSSSDYGLIVEDRELTAFMQKHDLNPGTGGTYFSLGRPVREICSALSKLTGQITDDPELFGITLSEDPRRQVMQRRLYERNALRWRTWWEMHSRELTDDVTYQKVNLKVLPETLPPASRTLGPHARLANNEGVIGAILSPAIQDGQHATYFLDLDTGFHPQWPAQFPKDQTKLDQKQLAAWASENGVDLMCIAHPGTDGGWTFVLRGFDLKAWELTPRDLRNLDKLIAASKPPEGREVGELLMHYDPVTRQLIPDANAAFLFVTREGSFGILETTDRVTRTANLTGAAGSPTPGVGFFEGVRFNLKTIIP
jgi:beta-lactamase regulating signal transducer with metallopeptidase domain/5-hydroxyisourate hydrolase-like protein (transthyretin family)